MDREICKAQQEGGQLILNKINKLNDFEIRELVSSILKNTLGETEDRYKDLLLSGKIKRVILNMDVQSIEIYDYSTLKIDWSGISYKPEGGPVKDILYMPGFIALSNFMKDDK